MKISFTKKPMKPMTMNPRAVCVVILLNSANRAARLCHVRHAVRVLIGRWEGTTAPGERGGGGVTAGRLQIDDHR